MPATQDLILEHIILRQLVAGDRHALVPLLMDEAFMAFSPSGAMRAAQAAERFENIVNAHQQHGTGKLAVVDIESTELIGYCGLEHCQLDGEDIIELGYRLKTSARGRGYAFDAASAVLDNWAKTGTVPKTVHAFTEPDNAVSIHILMKLGFHFIRHSRFAGMPIKVFVKRLD
jgi:[ribosomal protein S5]-alanine N-acetyltransferase